MKNLIFKKIILKFTITFLLLLIIILIYNLKIFKRKKIGVIGVRHCNNIGANLLKYAMSIKLSEFGFIPYIIGNHYKNKDISFLKKRTNCIIIKNNFSEIKKNYYDFLMVNSDQTWRRFDKHFYDHGFLNFAKFWDTPKFVYGASLGYNKWKLTKKDDRIIKDLLKNFTGISVREIGSIKMIERHLGIKPVFVLDPTLLIDKKYYLDLLNLYNGRKPIKNFIFTYILKKEKNIDLFIKKSSKLLDYEVFSDKKNDKNSIEKFIYGMANCKAVVTDSYHGTIFSIIFNKPFVTFIFSGSPKERFISLKEIFKIEDRIYENFQMPNINLLTTPLNINYTFINLLKKESINYLKKNLNIF